MIRNPVFLLLGAFLFSTTALLAQEDAALTKGYRAEEAASGSTGDDSAQDVISGPTVAPLPKTAQGSAAVGQSPASFSQRPGSASGGDAGSGAGISCEKSVPKLTQTYKKEIDFFDKLQRGNVIRFALAPNEAASWRFKTPSSGEGLIELSQATFATETSRMLTISETPCDFDEAKAMRKIAGCYQWFVNDGGIQFQIAPAHVGWNP